MKPDTQALTKAGSFVFHSTMDNQNSTIGLRVITSVRRMTFS
jgi:hypothetical protein